MKKATYAILFSTAFIFLSRLIFTFEPHFLKDQPGWVIFTSFVYLIVHAVPIYYFWQLRVKLVPELEIGSKIDLLLFVLILNLLHRAIIVLLNLSFSALWLERIHYNIRFVIPLILYNALLVFFKNLKKKSPETRLAQLESIFKMNETGFGLLFMITVAGLVDYSAGGRFFQNSTEIFSLIRIATYFVVIFVFYALIRFYLGISKVLENE